MAHANIYDPETNKWACWSTVVDDYITDWLPENAYRGEMIVDAIAGLLDWGDKTTNLSDILEAKIGSNAVTITIKDLSKFSIKKSDWYSKQDCDERRKIVHGGSEE